MKGDLNVPHPLGSLEVDVKTSLCIYVVIKMQLCIYTERGYYPYKLNNMASQSSLYMGHPHMHYVHILT